VLGSCDAPGLLPRLLDHLVYAVANHNASLHATGAQASSSSSSSSSSSAACATLTCVEVDANDGSIRDVLPGSSTNDATAAPAPAAPVPLERRANESIQHGEVCEIMRRLRPVPELKYRGVVAFVFASDCAYFKFCFLLRSVCICHGYFISLFAC